MPRRPRLATGDLAYHVLNRRVGRFPLFERPADYTAFEAKLVTQAEGWQWSRLWRRDQGDAELTAWLSDWPVERPRDWIARVNRPQTASELESLRVSVQRGRPFGEEAWVKRMAKRFGMESTLQPRGRPKQS
jgi:putative transposase